MEVAEHSAASSDDKSEALQREKSLVEQAAGIVVASQGKVKIVDSTSDQRV